MRILCSILQLTVLNMFRLDKIITLHPPGPCGPGVSFCSCSSVPLVSWCPRVSPLLYSNSIYRSYVVRYFLSWYMIILCSWWMLVCVLHYWCLCVVFISYWWHYILRMHCGIFRGCIVLFSAVTLRCLVVALWLLSAFFYIVVLAWLNCGDDYSYCPTVEYSNLHIQFSLLPASMPMCSIDVWRQCVTLCDTVWQCWHVMMWCVQLLAMCAVTGNVWQCWCVLYPS